MPVGGAPVGSSSSLDRKCLGARGPGGGGALGAEGAFTFPTSVEPVKYKVRLEELPARSCSPAILMWLPPNSAPADNAARVPFRHGQASIRR